MQVITHPKQGANISQAERWTSIVGGSALAAFGLMRRSPGGIFAALVGGSLIHRGATGHCYAYEAFGYTTAPGGQGAETTSVPYELGIRVDRSITIDRPRQEIYEFWRDLENLPRFMQHLESVKVDGDRSRWTAKAPAGRTVYWDAVILNEAPGERIAWRSLPGSQVDNAGTVIFRDAPGGRGTEVKVELQYNPPAGLVGAAVAKLWGEEPGQQIEEDLRRLKQLLEAGEILSVEGQSSGRDAKSTRATEKHEEKEVQYASELSFPASDSPSWNR